MKPIQPVYTYYYPEVRQIISDLTHEFPHDVFLQAINPWLDAYHWKAIDAYCKHYFRQLPKLSEFPYIYPLSWSSEGIFHILSHIVAFEKEKPLYIFSWEYEWYAAYWGNLWLHFTNISYGSTYSELQPWIFFISNPNSRDGNIIPNEEILAIAEAGHEIILDVAYVGTTKPYIY